MLNTAQRCFGKPLTIILCASNVGLTAGTWLGKHLQNTQQFKHDAEGLAAFNVYLKNHAHAKITLIANAIDESYSLEMLGHTTGKTRADLLERKLNQWSRNTLYKAAHFIERATHDRSANAREINAISPNNRATNQRQEDRFLFVAINNASFIQDWIAIINSEKALLVGIYMLPMISGMIGEIIARQQKLATRHILVCETMPSGFRQTYIHNGQLQMSRMLPINEVPSHKLSAYFAAEIDKTWLYLQSQHLITADTPLCLALLTMDNHQDITRLFNQAVNQEVNQAVDATLDAKLDQARPISSLFFDTYSFAKTLMLNPELIKLNPELLHMQLIANGSYPCNLAPPALTKSYQLHKCRQVIRLYSILVASFGLLIASFIWYQTLGLNAQISMASAQTAQQQRLYQQVTQTFPASTIATAELKSSVDLARAVLAHTQTPQRLMQVVSEALEQQPQIELMRLRWVLSNNSHLKDDTDINTQEGVAVMSAEKAQVTAELPIAAPFTLLEIGFVNAKINDFMGDYHAANISVSHLLAQLKSNPQVAHVLLLQAPINQSSLANLQGSTTENSSVEQTPALFKLKLVLKPLVLTTP